MLKRQIGTSVSTEDVPLSGRELSRDLYGHYHKGQRRFAAWPKQYIDVVRVSENEASPDGVVAWACDAERLDSHVEFAMTRWFGARELS